MGCQPASGAGEASLVALVQDYKDGPARGAKREARFYERQPSLDAAIDVAALAIWFNGQRHPHQRRIPKLVLRDARDRLRLRRSSMLDCQRFDELHRLVEETIEGIPGIGQLTVYDTSHRIGLFLGLMPARVYLHAGTTAGARALGLDARRGWIEVNDLPTELRALSPSELEDFLCIYKGALRTAGRRHRGQTTTMGT